MLLLGDRNGFNVRIGEVGDFNPAGLDNCGRLHSHVKYAYIHFFFLFYLCICRKHNIDDANKDQEVAVSVCDGRIFYDGSLVQEQRLSTAMNKPLVITFYVYAQ